MPKFPPKLEIALRYIEIEVKRIARSNQREFILKEFEVFDDGDPNNYGILRDALRLFQRRGIVRYAAQTQIFLDSEEVIWPISVFLEGLAIDRLPELRAGEFLPLTTRAEFNETNRRISVGEGHFELPIDSIEFYLCQEMFGHEIGEAVSWDLIYERFSGINVGNTHEQREKIKESIRAAYNRVNQKAQGIGIRQLFDRGNNSYTRIQ